MGMVEWGESALANSDMFCGSLYLCEGVVGRGMVSTF